MLLWSLSQYLLTEKSSKDLCIKRKVTYPMKYLFPKDDGLMGASKEIWKYFKK